jgi:SET domain-containing protein
LEIEKEFKIVIYARRDIKPGEELTYDYCFDEEEVKLACTCKAPTCQGRLN